MANWYDGLKSDAKLWSAVTLVLGLLEKSGMPGKRQDLDDEETRALYVQDCKDAGLSPELVWKARDHVRRGFTFFPLPHEFAKSVRDFRGETWRQITEKVLEDGQERLSIRYVDPDSDEYREFVASLKSRPLALEDLASAKERFEKNLSKLEAKVSR